MYATPKMIINHHNLIVDSEVPSLLHLNSYQMDDNAMQGFN
jgi:hypothetical protein